jgi:multiple sugar transport system ATP-binding protein
MDEPLSNLDAKLRVQMRAEIARIQRDLGVTTIYVTHDQTEAMTLGDRVAVMKKGLLQQVAGPQELYDHPRNLFVAGFIGSPAMNLVQGRLSESGGDLQFAVGSQTLPLDPAVLSIRPALRGYVGRDVVAGVRPEDMEDAALVAGGDGSTLRSSAELVEAMGSDVLVHFAVDAPMVVTEDTRELARDAGTDVLGATGDVAPGRAGAGTAGGTGSGTVMIARFNPRTRVRVGEPVTVHVDTARTHFFDPDTGLSIWTGDDTDAQGGTP